MNMSTLAATPEQVLLRLDWNVIRRLDGLLQGDYRTLFYGFGVDFADLREYQPGDDIRYIDWNVTARMASPYVRQYHEDREITAWFLLDLSPSMDFGTTAMPREKRTRLIEFSAVIARLLTRHGNRVGAMMFGNGIQHTVPVRGGKIQVLRLINDMMKQPRLPGSSFTNLKLFFEGALNSIKRRSLVFVLSDFISEPGWERSLSLLGQHHEVIAVRLFDAREEELPDVGMVVLEDAETGAQMFLDTHDLKFRKKFFAAAQQREQDLNAAFKRAGVDVLPLSTEDDLVRAIVRFAKQRKQVRKN